MSVEREIEAALRTVYDPEIPVNIFELGLIYSVHVEPDGMALIQMTLTSPGCPVAVELPVEVKSRVESVPGVSSCEVDVVWDPPWSPAMMSDAARLELGLM